MTQDIEAMLVSLRRTGWRVERRRGPIAIPNEVAARYPRVPSELTEFLTDVRSCVNSTETAWLLCEQDYKGQNADSQFRWDEFEHLSMQAAGIDQAWKDEIRRFWDRFLPIGQSVESGYSFLAIDTSGEGFGSVVCGTMPEFDEPDLVCASFEELLEMLGRLRTGPLLVAQDFSGDGGSKSGGWHYPHPLSLGGSPDQMMVNNGETRRILHPEHLDASAVHLKVLRVLRRKARGG